MASGVLQSYQEALADLKSSDKTTINFLSMLAEDNRDEAAGISAVIEQHLLTVRGKFNIRTLLRFHA